MRRTTALRFAILALLAAGSAAAQTFSVTRDFDLVRNAQGRPLHNIYWVSLPLDPVLNDDCDRFSAGRSPCVGDPGGPTSGDGILDSGDLVCAWWTARSTPATAGSMIVSRWDTATCAMKDQIATIGFGGRITLAGEDFAFDPHAGYQVRVGVPAGAPYSPRNPVVLRGEPDPSWMGETIVAPTACGPLARRSSLLVLPYETAYTSSLELGCGLRTVDWLDERHADGSPGEDGLPDTCWDDVDGDRVFDAGEPLTGLFDGLHSISVMTFVNRPEINAPVATFTRFQLNRLLIGGMAFDLVPGEAYFLDFTPQQLPVLWRPPAR